MKIFIGLLTGLVTGSNHTKCMSLNYQKCKIQPTVINLHPNEYSKKLHYYPFTDKLDVLKVVILLTYLIKFVFQKKRKFKSKRVQHDHRNK